MKRILFIIVFVICTSTIFSQYNMNIKKTDNSTTVILTSDISEITFTNAVCGTYTVSYGGITYNTVLIGSQCWLKENLNIGTMISGSSNQTDNSIIEKYCYNNEEENCTSNGGLYQWAEAVQYQNGATNSTSPNPEFSGNVKGICPTGWHVPTYTELQTLKTSVSSNGNALLAAGQGAGTNSSGFSALLSGMRWLSGFIANGSKADFWSSSYYDLSVAYYMELFSTSADIYMGYVSKSEYGFSVRCVRD